jgi:hypothetical protein
MVLTRRGLLTWAAALCIAAGVVLACSSPADPPAACPDDQATCPVSPPSWATQVQPIVQKGCFPCHADGGAAGPQFDYSTYAGVHRAYTEMIVQLSACNMPPADAAPLSGDDRATLLAWLGCRAPNN